MEELSIRAANQASPPDDEFGSPRRMNLTERMQFIAIFVAAVLLSIVAALAILPFVLFSVIKQTVSRRES